MIWYIGFQRGPPLRIRSGGQVTVSPLIATDLRDAQYQPEDTDGAVELCFSWVVRASDTLHEAEAPHHSGWINICQAGTCTWSSPQSAYKPVQLQAPTAAQLASKSRNSSQQDGKANSTGQIYLAIYAKAGDRGGAQQGPSKRRKTGHSEDADVLDHIAVDITDLCPDAHHSTVGICENVKDIVQPTFVPALSAPITIVSSIAAAEDTARSNDTVRLLRSQLPSGHGWLATFREVAGYELDKHVWDASHLLAAYLSECARVSCCAPTPSEFNVPPWARMLFKPDDSCEQPFCILELGAGTGCTGLSLAAMLHAHHSTRSTRQIDLTLTDLEPAMELLESNIELNAHQERHPQLNIDCAVLDWGEVKELGDWVGKPASEGREHQRPDLILVSDCTYNQDSFDALCDVLALFLTVDVPASSPELARTRPVCLLAKKHRHPDERSLWSKLRERRLHWKLLEGEDDHDPPDGDGNASRVGLYEISSQT